MDIDQYVMTSEDAWQKLSEQLRQIIGDVSADVDRLKKLELEVAALRSANSERLSVLGSLRDEANAERQRATSLTLMASDDGIVLDEGIPVIPPAPFCQESTTLVAEEISRAQIAKGSAEKSKGSGRTNSARGRGKAIPTARLDQPSLPLEPKEGGSDG